MYVMSWFGIGTAIGFVIDVPILLRSLADSLADLNLDHLPLGFNSSMLAALDDGVATESPNRLVDSYACDWWRRSTEPALGGIFGIDTLDECLNRHRQYINISDSSRPDIQSATDNPHSQPDCRSCIDLRALIYDMFDEARAMHDFINGCESSADAAMNANVRKAAGLHRLHELALLKELQSESQPLSQATALKTVSKNTPRRAAGRPKKTARQSALVSAHAQAELEHLKSLPPTSHKWTWGVDVTESDVLGSNPTTKSKHHSGYARTLADGVYDKEWSITASFPTAVSGAYGSLPTVTGIDAGLCFSDDEAQSDADADADIIPEAADADDEAEEDSPDADADDEAEQHGPDADEAEEDGPDTDAEPEDDIPVADADQLTMLGQPTGSYAAMLWEGEDYAPDHVDQSTVFQAALAWQDNDTSSSSSHTGSPNAFDAATFYLADSTSASPSPPASPILTTFPTASDAADVFLSSAETDSPGSNANSVLFVDSFRAESPGTSQIENLPASLPIYSHVDFSYIDDTWLAGSDDMMDTSDME